MIFLFVLLFGCLPLQTASQISACPTACNCSGNGTLGCLQCLQAYYRGYSAASKNCPCTQGFVELEVPGQYCCSSNCTTCSAIGNCVTCPPNWQLVLSDFGVRVCVCRDNYYFDGTNCKCLSHVYPDRYYEVQPESACFDCPYGCVCTIDGCISCDTTTHRAIMTVKLNSTNHIKSCPCLPPFWLDGTMCSCPHNCDCTLSILDCNTSASYRFQTAAGDWWCSPPFQQISGQCVCVAPHLFDSVVSDCECESLSNAGLAYLNSEEECVVCPNDCTCSNIGCVSCGMSANRQISGNSCPCSVPYIEIKGVCECFSPFYYNNTRGLCVCMSEMYPAKYYFNILAIEGSSCRKCPVGCTCSTSGCYKCSPAALRSVTTVDLTAGNYSLCNQCVDNAKEIDGVCVCNDGGLGTDGKCGCTVGTFNYLDAAQFKCLVCPYGCLCSEQQGCYSCSNDTYRNVSLNTATMWYTCYCINTARVGDVSGNCYCEIAVDQNDSTKCTCPQPYFMLESGACSCKSAINYTGYYYDVFSEQCMLCPTGCTCDNLGCKHCHPNALRFVYLSTYYYDCPCLQIAKLKNSTCYVCPPNAHYVSGQCILCLQCKTCDWNGLCLSCGDDMNLTNNGTCICQNSALINLDGLCRCQIGFYWRDSTTGCVPCPSRCFDCFLPPQTAFANCSTCQSGMNRVDDPGNNCPCVEGYKENPTGDNSYCCSKQCYTCNKTGCTSCQADMFRILNGSQCICMGNLTQANDTQLVCGCPDGNYRYSIYCQLCPPRCQMCFFNWTSNKVQCSSCPNNSNRDMGIDFSGVIECNCLEGFAQATPALSFCYPRYCLSPSLVCSACRGNRYPTNKGSTCSCYPGYFENGRGECIMCEMEGCLTCVQVNSCRLCNQSQHYFLTDESCKLQLAANSYLYSQSSIGVIVQFINSQINVSEYPIFVSASSSLQKIRYFLTDQSEIVESTVLNTSWGVYTTNNTITMLIQSPEEGMLDAMLAIKVVFTRQVELEAEYYYNDGNHLYAITDGWVYIKLQEMYSAERMKYNRISYHLSTYILSIIIVTVSGALYIKGFKHNQSLFFLQTMSFMGFAIRDPSLHQTVYLYNLKLVYFGTSPLAAKLIPYDYFQSSKGNFEYLTGDSNLFRVASATVFIAIINAACCGVFRLVYVVCNYTRLRTNQQVERLMMSQKKILYRSMEFIYKVCMYPLIFFSFINIQNWKPTVLTSHPGFTHFTRGAAVAFFLSYLLVTMYQVWGENIAKINRIENAMEFLSACACALILCNSLHNHIYLYLTIVFSFRAGCYIMLRRIILRDFRSIEYIKILSTVCQCSAILLTLTSKKAAVLPFIIAAVLTQTIHAISVISLTDNKAFYLKRERSEPSIETETNINPEMPSQTGAVPDFHVVRV